MEKYKSLLAGLLHNYPSYLIFFVTARCNSRCKMCFYWKEIEKAKNKKELSIKEIEKITKHFKTLPYVSLGGGEPFLRPDIDKICRLFYKHCNTRFINIPTNGILTSAIGKKVRNILEKCPEAQLNIDLSIDGIGKLHDRIRGVKGNFKKVIETYQKLCELRKKFKNLSINVLTVLSRYNENKILEIIDYIEKNLDVNSHRIGLARIDSKEQKAKEVSMQQYKKCIDILNRTKKASRGFFAGVLHAVYETSAEIAYETRKNNKVCLQCVAGKKLIVISEEGNVYPCELLSKKMGNIRDYEYDIGKLLASKTAKEIIKFIKKTKCHCTWECGIMNSLFFNPKFYPKILKNAIQLK